jgi:hypothetical protein
MATGGGGGPITASSVVRPVLYRVAMRLRPKSWSVGVLILLTVAAVALWMDHERLAGTASLGAGLAWLAFGSLPVADRHNATNIAAATAAVTLVVTWTSALLGALVYASYAAHEADAKVWIPIMLLAATNIGGLVAVFRSAQTRTETSAALREVSDLRIAVLSAPVVEAADRASRAKTIAELSESLGSMLQLAVNLSLLPRAIDQASLWALDEANGEWFICAATAPAPEQERFVQRTVTTETPGAGLVAHLAAGIAPPTRQNTALVGDVYLVGEGLGSHPWYLVNPNGETAEGIAVVLLRRAHKPFGALCFTWASKVVPTTGSRASEMIDILQRWAQAFGVGLARLYRFREETTP